MREPILVIVAGGTALVQAVLQLLIAAHVSISPELAAAIQALASVLLAAYGRSQVTPMATLPAGVAAKIADAKANP